VPVERNELVELLARAGFLSAPEDAAALLARAGADDALLGRLVDRRLAGEPLAWLVGFTVFCGHTIVIEPGVYVPREQTELVAGRAIGLLPADGVAVDVATGSGAVAMALARARPDALVLATELDPTSAACARANGVVVYQGDLLDPLPATAEGLVDVICGSVPYVPTPALGLLQRDTFRFEAPLAYDGGPDGLGLLRRVAFDARQWLRPGGALVLELGGDQARALAGDLATLGYTAIDTLVDSDGDVRGVEARFASGLTPG